MKRKLFTVFLTAALMVSSCFTASPALAKQSDIADYSSAKALEYAKANTADDSQDTDDCVVFVRACVEAGGVPTDAGRTYGYSVRDYADYLIQNDYVEVFEVKTSYYYASYAGFPSSLNQGHISPGDIFLYHCNNASCSKPDFHVSLAGTDQGNYKGKYYGYWTYYQHNPLAANKTALKLKCSKCGAAADTTTVYVLHFKSAENGYVISDSSPADTEVVKPDKPVITVKKSSSTSIKISWEAVEGADGYRIYRATSKNGTYKSIKTITDPATLSYINKKLTKGKRYYYKVKAFTYDGDTRVYSSYSGYKSAKL